MKGNEIQIAAGKANLLLLASILDEADAHHGASGEPAYCQAAAVHDDGAPSCALSHWCEFKGMAWLDGDIVEVEETFSIDAAEAQELFSGCGCGNAATARDAAAYVRQFLWRQEGMHRSRGELTRTRAAHFSHAGFFSGRPAYGASPNTLTSR